MQHPEGTGGSEMPRGRDPEKGARGRQGMLLEQTFFFARQETEIEKFYRGANSMLDMTIGNPVQLQRNV